MNKLNDKQEGGYSYVEKILMVSSLSIPLIERSKAHYVSKEKQSNNEPCKCRSGLKYKKCCKFK